MNLYGNIDLGAYFGAEVRIIDGEEYICIPRRFNPTIQFFGGHATLLLDILETKRPDEDGFTHLCIPHLPKALLQTLPEADFVKMTAPVGKLKVLKKLEEIKEEEPKKEAEVGSDSLAPRPVRDIDIPL